MDGRRDANGPYPSRLYAGGVGGPPWVLGHRGAPREAPENTLASLRRALELGLDGVEYDLQALATGEAVLLHDDTLGRTTDHAGPVGELTLPELLGVDAGGWFHKRFAGEPLPLLQEALELPVNPDDAGAGVPLHMIEVKDPSLVAEVARRVAEFRGRVAVRLASFDREACVEAQSLGLQAMLLAARASEEDRRFVRDARLSAYGVGPWGWNDGRFRGARTGIFQGEWPCERWGWSIDEPDECLWAARAPLFGWNTNEPHRSLAARALARLAPADDGPWPVRLPGLEVVPDPRGAGTHGPWSGRWSVTAAVRNPFGHSIAVQADLLVRGGAFEVHRLPASARVAPGDEARLAFEVAGGSWSPGEDPRLLVRLAWRRGPGRASGELVLDTTLERRREATLGRDPLRLPMLAERPGERPATMVIRRRGRELLARVEDPGGLRDVRALVRLGHVVTRGAVGARVRLPDDFDRRAEGMPFACGFQGRDADGRRILRRWSGGVPAGLAHGAPGRLHAAASA